jgi:hypothetical protein
MFGRPPQGKMFFCNNDDIGRVLQVKIAWLIESSSGQHGLNLTKVNLFTTLPLQYSF